MAISDWINKESGLIGVLFNLSILHNLAFDLNEGNVVDSQVDQENFRAEQGRRRIGGLITWLGISIVGMIVIYLLFSVVRASS